MEEHSQWTSTTVVGGIDAHSNIPHGAALDSSGRRLGSQEFLASTRGYQDALDWLGRFGVIDKIGIESTGSYAAGITKFLLARGVEVIEVNQPLTATTSRAHSMPPNTLAKRDPGAHRRDP